MKGVLELGIRKTIAEGELNRLGVETIGSARIVLLLLLESTSNQYRDGSHIHNCIVKRDNIIIVIPCIYQTTT